MICLIVETNYAEAKVHFLNTMACLNFGIIVVYTAIWIVIKLRNGKYGNAGQTKVYEFFKKNEI